MLENLYGYEINPADYPVWTSALEKFVIEESKESALFPLLHFVLDNLPQDTKAPELDDSNAAKSLKQDSKYTGEILVLVKVWFGSNWCLH